MTKDLHKFDILNRQNEQELNNYYINIYRNFLQAIHPVENKLWNYNKRVLRDTYTIPSFSFNKRTTVTVEKK